MSRFSRALAALVLACLVCGAAYAQVPTAISYQGRLSDLAGAPVADGAYSMRFRIYNTQSGGSLLWDSNTMSVNVEAGVFTAELQPITASNLTSSTAWIEPTIGETTLPRTRLVSVPYALRAGDLVLPFTGTVSNSSPAIQVTNTASEAVRGVSGSTASSMSAVVGRMTATSPGSYSAGVRGISDGTGSSGVGVYGSHAGSGWGVYGVSPSGIGVYGTSTSGTGGYFDANGGSPALYAVNNSTGQGIYAYGQVAGDFVGLLRASAFRMTASPAAGYVLTSDAIGNATWQPAATSGWSLTGNSGTSPTTNFVGTIDNQPLVIRSNSARGFQIGYAGRSDTTHNYYSMNVLGGYQTNAITDGAIGATVGGGGMRTWAKSSGATVDYNNRVTDDFGTVAGGYLNQAGDSAGTVSDKQYATVGGGNGNVASGIASTVPGGYQNNASGSYSFAAGMMAKANHQGSFVWSDSTGSAFSSTANNQFLIRASGGVGIGTNAPTGGLEINTGLYNGLRVTTTASNGNGVYSIANSGTGAYGVYGSSTDGRGVVGGSTSGYGVYGTSSSGMGVYGNSTSHIGVYGNSTSNAGVVGASSTGFGVYASSSSNHAMQAQTTSGFGLFATSANSIAVYGSAPGSATEAGHFDAPNGTSTGIYARGGDGGGKAAIFDGNLQIRSRGTGAVVIELGEGLDYAEGFNVSDRDSAKPGTVLVIDPNNPGKLAISTNAYDRKVAGIITGANNLGSAVRLGAGQFDHDVALAGRVFCNVDATEDGIEPGDLLTTSDTPGFAMRATDSARSQGAILGKAMQRLEKGSKGQILVLVTLQ